MVSSSSVRSPGSILVAALAVFASLPAGAAEPGSYWNASRTRIYTILPDGTRVPGGQVGDIRMIQFPLVVGPGGVMVDFVRSRTRSGGPLRWEKSCVFITPDAAGSADVPGDGELQALDRVLASWEAATQACSYLTFEREPPVEIEVGFDGKNVIKYRGATWCRPATMEDPEECYNPQAAAITTLFFIDRPMEADDGVILDSDIELNEVNFATALDCDGAMGCQTQGMGTLSDLENTLTHEIGHLIGLDHTCFDGTTPEPPVDDTGATIPPCEPEADLSLEIREATMYNYQSPGETKKRTPEQDDIDGVCAIYPLADDPGSCRPVDIDGQDGCCAVAGRPPAGRTGSGVWLILAAAVLALVRRRR